MIRTLIDTSAYSSFMRGNPTFKQAVQKIDAIYFNPIVIGELLTGFLKGKRREENKKELDVFLSSPRVKILEINEETGEKYAVILNALWKAGTPVPTNDIWIAASAMQYGLRVLTSDMHYGKIPQITADIL
ncbi:MAG: type II toxin-antitoxin system VapC family toxin [Candidatus Eremiobacteraeota bacterium]|jgi:predicted nucleic acid-binding protein|nr:type II toxin-antitoxin system VapC family toxin [Candidatus Eremiobacteraeota bacterium]MCL5054511.1 type II toxin-antitoxin system VapC family toxin [Bacillota bacterium]